MYRLKYFYKNGHTHLSNPANSLDAFAKALDKIEACHACMRKFEKVQILKDDKIIKELII